MKEDIVRKNLLVNIVTVIIFFIISIFVMSSVTTSTISKSLNYLSTFIEKDFNNVSEDFTINDIFSKYTNDSQYIRIIVSDDKGFITNDSYHSKPELERDEYISSLELKKAFNEEKDAYYDKDYISIIRYIGTDCIVKISIKLEATTGYILNMSFLALIVLLVVTFLTMISTIRVSERVTSGYKQIFDSLKSIEDNDFKDIELNNDYSEVNYALKEVNKISNSLRSYINTIEEDKNRAEFVFNNIHHGIVIIDRDKNIFAVNQTYLKTFNKKTDDNFDTIFENEDVKNSIDECLKENKETYFDFVDKNSEKIYEVSIYNLLNDLMMIVVNDVDQIRKTEKNKLEFLSNASHELKTPITSIMGFSELLLNFNNDPTNQKYLSIIHNEANNMKDTINDFLFISKLENMDAITYEITDIEAIINSIILVNSSLINETKVNVVKEINYNNFLTNKVLIKHLLANLINNAIKYNKTNGKVIISINESNNKIIIEVADTGVGIDPKELPKIYDRFYRIDKSHHRGENNSGTGLGLNIVKQIINLLKANIEVYSTVNKGTTFIITLDKINDNK